MKTRFLVIFWVLMGAIGGIMAYALINQPESCAQARAEAVAIPAQTATNIPVTATTSPKVCRMAAYRLVEIEKTSPMIFIYLAQGMNVTVARRANGTAWVDVVIGGTEMLAGVPESVVICEEWK